MATFPTIHLNGSSGESLCEELNAAREKLRGAISAVQDLAPHGRDYYVQENAKESLALAIREHYARLEVLSRVYEELGDIRDNVVSQMEARRKR